MKNFLLPLFILLSFIRTVAAGPLPSAAPDTTTGHARLVRDMAAAVCTRLEEENKKKPLGTVTPEEGKTLLTSALLSSMGQFTDQLMPMMAEATKAGGTSQSVGMELGRDVVLLLGKNCAVSQALIVRMGLDSYKDKPTISEKEKPLIQKMAASACQSLDKDNAAQPLAKMTAEQRAAAFAKALQGAFSTHEKSLKAFYGPKLDDQQAEMTNLGRKVAMLMSESCPSYVLQVGLDQAQKH
jgi:hypothetical protein